MLKDGNRQRKDTWTLYQTRKKPVGWNHSHSFHEPVDPIWLNNLKARKIISFLDLHLNIIEGEPLVKRGKKAKIHKGGSIWKEGIHFRMCNPGVATLLCCRTVIIMYIWRPIITEALFWKESRNSEPYNIQYPGAGDFFEPGFPFCLEPRGMAYRRSAAADP